MWTWVLLAMIGVLSIFFLIAGALFVKRSLHDKKLHETSDYAFQTKKGNYSFSYLIKGFKTEEGKLIKLAVQPFVGFSDFAHALTSWCNFIRIVCKDRKTGEEIITFDETDISQSNRKIDSEVLIPSKFLDEFGNADLEVKIGSSWNLGGDTVYGEIKFAFQK